MKNPVNLLILIIVLIISCSTEIPPFIDINGISSSSKADISSDSSDASSSSNSLSSSSAEISSSSVALSSSIGGFSSSSNNIVSPGSSSSTEFRNPCILGGECVDRASSICKVQGGTPVSSCDVDLCADFKEGNIVDHLGMDKRQFCDKRDGKKYVYVTIGEGKTAQTWMAENLNYNTNTDGSKCYSNQEANCDTYGRLYNWTTAMEVCPSGWHLPSQAEWNALTAFIQSDKGCSDCDAKHLKAESGWNSNGNGEDSYGFTALPGGNGNSDGNFGNVGNYGDWWSSSESNSSYAYHRYMYYINEYAYWGNDNKDYLYSVRCAQD